MENRELKIEYIKRSYQELDNNDRTLVDTAIESAKNAYAPYSGFRVGAALLLSDGTVIKGNNQENAAYPSGLCAERVALFFANANYSRIPLDTLVVTAIDSDDTIVDDPISPCGSCRQVIAESEMISGKPLRILLASGNAILEFSSVESLLPFTFTKDDLF